MKRNCLYTVNPWNTNIFACGGNKHAFGDFLKEDSNSYMGNWLGANNMSKGAGAMVGALGTAVGGLGSKLIGGGYDAAGVGNGITTIGSTIGGAVSQVNPLVGGIISAGSGIIGGTVNRLWGMKTNQEALNKANSNITAMKNFNSNASTFDNVETPMAVGNVGTVYKGGVFKKGSARRKNAALQRDLDNAVDYAYNSVDNNIANLQSDQYNNLLASSFAFGGPIGLAPMTGALGIMQADKYINAINNRTNAIAKNNTEVNTSSSFSPLGNAFADGGGIHIKPSHKGLFTEKANRAGMGVQAYASHVLANKEDYPSSTVKQANFAKNAAGWKHDAGGSLEAAFLDNFSSDPLGAVMQYNRGLEAMAAQREAEEAAAAQQAAYDDMQKRMLAAETERQGLQSMLDSQGLTIQALMDAQRQNNYAEGWKERMGMENDLATPLDSAVMARMRKSLKDRGITKRTYQDAVIANMMVESGGNPNAKNANSSARGLMQWTTPRHPKAWDWDSQVDHIVNTLESGFEDKKALERFRNTNDSAEAARIFRQYWERPEKHTYNWTDKWINKMYGEKKAFGGLLNSKNLFALGGPDDDVLGWNPVDTRSDTTRQGYHEGNMSYGANYQGPLGTAKLVLDTYAKDHNPNLITGIAPTPYLKGKPNMAYAESYMKKHGLKSFSAANGKRYVKTPDGKVKSLESLAREEEARISQGAVEEFRRNAEEAKAAGVVIDKPYRSAPLRDPAVNLDATKGSINRGKLGKVSNRNAQTANDLYAFGGELGTNGTDFTTGLLEINTGNSHEENPHEGVQLGFDEQGIPNLVEEGETVYNDYVFSNRLKVPAFMRRQLGLGGSMKDEITFAAASKKIAEAGKERPNNPMDMDYMDDALGKLAQVQEAERMRMQAERQNDEMERINAMPMEGMMQGAMGLQAANGGRLNKYDEGGNTINPYAYDRSWDGFKYFNPEIGKYDADYLDFVNNINQDWVNRIMRGQYGSMDRYLARNSGVTPTIAQVQALASDKMYSDMHKAMAAAYEDYLKGIDPVTGEATLPEVEVTASNRNTNNYPQTYWGPGVDNTSFWTAAQQAGYTGLPEVDWRGNAGAKAPVYVPEGATAESIGVQAPMEVPSVLEERRKDPNDPMNAGVKGNNNERKPYATWMRYAPAVGTGIMTLTDLLGLTNRPDYTYADKLEAAANRAGYAPSIRYTPIGDYMTYRPLDRLFYANQLQANSRATDRALVNTSGGNRGTAQAAMLANGYNTNNNLGNLYRQAEEYNLAQREKVADFNRRTNMFNSQMGLEADMANARYRQQAANAQLSGLAQAAAMRDSIDQRVGAARSANITNLLNNLGNIGRENFALNQINWDRSNKYGARANGTSYYKKPSANGGKINKRK